MYTGQMFCMFGEFAPEEAADETLRTAMHKHIVAHGGSVVTAIHDKVSYAIVGAKMSHKRMEQLQSCPNIVLLTRVQLLQQHPTPMSPTSPEHVTAPVQTVVPANALPSEPTNNTQCTATATPHHLPVESPAHEQLCTSRAPVAVSLLLADKYAPKTSLEIVGNGAAVRGLRKWLSGFDSQTARNKAVLLSGPPGIGKSTLATVLAKECGYGNIMELNASDTRNKASIEELLADTGKAHGATFFNQTPKTCVIMDEVDGMGVGDHGGAQALVNIIKLAKCPVVCICNDKYATAVKSLKPHCQVIDMVRPSVAECMGRVQHICRAEHLTFTDAQLKKIVTECNGDMRHALVTMQFGSTRGNCATDKDSISPFESVRTMFSANATMEQREQAHYSADGGDMMPLFVAENYTSTARAAKQLDTLAAAADAISLGDLMQHEIQAHQHWDLAPLHAYQASVIPATLLGGGITGKIEFPQSLGKLSTARKRKRELDEMMRKMTAGGGGGNFVSYEDVPMMRTLMLLPQAQAGTAEETRQAVEEVAQVLKSRGLDKADYDSIAEYSLLSGDGDKLLKRIPAAAKRMLTQRLKQQSFDTTWRSEQSEKQNDNL